MTLQRCVCGTRFDPAVEQEVRLHDAQHDEWEHGVLLPPLDGERVVGRWGELDVVLVTPESSLAWRQQAERLARRAMLDTPFHVPAYTIENQDPDLRVFIAREGDRAVGLAILRLRHRWGWWSWDDFDAERRPNTPVAPLPCWTVEQIWTLPARQQRGVAHRLLDVAASSVDRPISSFAWRRPFTPSGEAFVRQVSPVGFWVPD